ncbi:hypothetical protein [Corynebacterium provencense]|uniref:hypothetical protein n=1 Tax=Corynebacterium provencense TaxID=1737425 RepID=UPI0008362F40|nr:hypothetical protein [Corynebacterium provencense]
MSNTRHAATISERIAAREGAGTHRERLQAADMILWEALRKVQESTPEDRAVLFTDLGLETADYTYLTDILATALRGITARQEQATQVFDSYPLITLSTLVGTALLSRGDSFWESYATRLHFAEGEDAGGLLRPIIPNLLSKLNLSNFVDADLGSQQYVGTITLHAGIPNQDLADLLEHLECIHLAGATGGDAEAVGRQMQRELVNGTAAKISLISLARVLPERAADIFARIYELQQYSAEYGGWPADEGTFEGTNGLPEPTFSRLVSLFSGEDVSEGADDTVAPETAALPVPYLQLNQEDLQFELVFPEHRWSGRTCQWTVQSPEGSAAVAQAPNVSYGGFEERRVPLTSIFTTLQVTGPDGHTHELGVSNKRPIILLRPNGHLRRDQESFKGTEVLAAVHDGVTTNVTDHKKGAIVGWPSWSLRCFYVADAKSVDVRKGSFFQRYKANRESSPIWDDGEGVLRNLVGPDNRPVFTSSPLITLPMDTAAWTLTWTRTNADGSLLEFDVDADIIKGEPMELFPTIPGDPWVGHYTVELCKNGRARDRRTFNMAEGLSAKISFGSTHSRGEFQFLRLEKDRNVLSPAFIEFSAPAHSHLSYPQEVRRHQSASSYTISSTTDPDAILAVTPQVPQLQYLLPKAGEMPQWVGAYQQIDADELSDTELFRLRFPVPVYEVTLMVVPVDEQKKSAAGLLQTITPESAKNGREWSCPALELTSAMTTDADYRILVAWQPQTVKQFVDAAKDNPRLRREFYSKKKGFQDPRPAAPLSQIFRVTKNPLLTDATITGTRLKLTLGRHIDDDLVVRAWQVTAPLADAIEIPMNGTTGTLPDALVDAGPLIIEARENNMDMLFNGWAGDLPTPKAIVVDQAEYQAPDAPRNPQRWMFDTADDRILLSNELQDVWTARDRFNAVLDAAPPHINRRLGDFDIATRTYLNHDPRTSLTELNESGVPADRQVEAFVRSRLTLASFGTVITAGDIHREPWIGLIQEMNDVFSLDLANRVVGYEDDDEINESRDYLKTTGGHDLWLQFNGIGHGCSTTRDAALKRPALQLLRNNGTEQFLSMIARGDDPNGLSSGFISIDSRAAAQAELVRHRSAVNTIWELPEMYRRAEQWADLLFKTFEDPELRQTIAALSELPNSEIHHADDEWLRAPLVSFVFSFLARGIAQGIVRPIPEFTTLTPSWALLARHLPTLTAFDLVTAEAAALAATTATYRKASHV